MKSLLIKISVMALVIAGIAAFVIRPGISSADPVVYTVTGHAFSDMPDASDQVKTLANHYGGRGLGWIAMKGSNYGVTLNSATGDFGGYGWSEFGGYVNFSGVKVDKTCLASNNPCDVTGTFTFVSAAADPQSGGWDGQVRMSDPSWTRTVSMKAPVNGVREMTGFAWGGDVVGWVDFSQVKVNVSKDLCTNMFGIQETVPEGYVKDPASPTDEPGVCSIIIVDICTNIDGLQTEVPSGYIKDPASPADAPGICTILPPGDICDNIDGIQLTVADIPAGYAQPAPGSTFCPPTNCVPGKPCDKCWNVDGVQLSVPPPYNTTYPTNQCVIAGCMDPRDTVHYNSAATVDNNTCSICDEQSKSWNPDITPPGCSKCNPTTPGYNRETGRCPKGMITPILKEV